MKLLCFQAKRFHWKTHSKILPEVTDLQVDEEVGDTVVVFVHAETSDEDETRTHSVLRQSLKHIKWLAIKRAFKNIVIHSFTHLGAKAASAAFAQSFITSLAHRLEDTGYRVWTTPFGYFCEWDLSVNGESLAKVWKEIQ